MSMDTTLVIIAAGSGTQYCSGIKQLAAVIPDGEPIID